jgi:hypothetical protein
VYRELENIFDSLDEARNKPNKPIAYSAW